MSPPRSRCVRWQLRPSGTRTQTHGAAGVRVVYGWMCGRLPAAPQPEQRAAGLGCECADSAVCTCRRKKTFDKPGFSVRTAENAPGALCHRNGKNKAGPRRSVTFIIPAGAPPVLRVPPLRSRILSGLLVCGSLPRCCRCCVREQEERARVRDVHCR